jgi:lysyl-tRNA synthetase class 2
LADLEDVGRLGRQRQEKLSLIKQLGTDPYGSRYDDVDYAENIKRSFKDNDDTQRAKCAGRIVLLRDIGKLIFLTLRDSSGTIQVGLSKNLLAQKWELAKLLELGDIVGVQGRLGKTKTGEITIWVSENGLTFLSKCLSPPPEKYHGLSDIDQRYRQRYVDLWANPEVMQRFVKRSAIINSIREFLKLKGFLEVETPMMQTIAV